MSKQREPETQAVLEAKAELGKIVADLRAAKTRAMTLERRLKRAARTGEVVGTIGGKAYTVEESLAGEIHSNIHDNDGHLAETIRSLARLARENARSWARVVVKDCKGELARKPAAAKEQAPAPATK